MAISMAFLARGVKSSGVRRQNSPLDSASTTLSR